MDFYMEHASVGTEGGFIASRRTCVSWASPYRQPKSEIYAGPNGCLGSAGANPVMQAKPPV